MSISGRFYYHFPSPIHSPFPLTPTPFPPLYHPSPLNQFPKGILAWEKCVGAFTSVGVTGKGEGLSSEKNHASILKHFFGVLVAYHCFRNKPFGWIATFHRPLLLLRPSVDSVGRTYDPHLKVSLVSIYRKINQFTIE